MKKFSVLIADDHRDWCQLLKNKIEKDALFNVAEPLYNGKDALEYIENNRPDIVILDLIMPVFDGLYVIEYLRKKIQGYSPIIYVLSAIGTEKTNKILRNLDVDYYSIKPMSTLAVVNILHKLVEADQADTRRDGQKQDYNIRKDIEDYLYKLGAPLYLLSTKCTCTVLQMCIENDWESKNITTLYSIVARASNATPVSIEQNIRSTIRKLQSNASPFFIQCFPDGDTKLTNAEFIMNSIYFLRRRIGENLIDQVTVRRS